MTFPPEQPTPTGEQLMPTLEPSNGAEEDADPSAMNSYRNYTVMWDGDAKGPILVEFTAVWDAETSASRTVAGYEGQAAEACSINARR